MNLRRKHDLSFSRSLLDLVCFAAMAQDIAATGPSPQRVPIRHLDSAMVLALDGQEVGAGLDAAADVVWQIRLGTFNVRDEEHHRIVRRAAFLLIDTGHPVHTETGLRLAREWMKLAAKTGLSSSDVQIAGCSPPWQLRAACLLAGAEHRLDRHRRALALTRPHLRDLELLCRSAAGVAFPEALQDLGRLDHLTAELRNPKSPLRRPTALLLKIMLPAIRASLPLTNRHPIRMQILDARTRQLDPLVDAATALLVAGYEDLSREEAHGLSSQDFFALCERRDPANRETLALVWDIDGVTRPATVRSRATAWLMHVAHAQWRGDAAVEQHYTRIALAALEDACLSRHVEAILRRGWLHSCAA
jgi:hypothetical protein